MAKAKSKNRFGIIVAIVLVLCIAVGVVFVIAQKDDTPASVMECNVNPNCQFVLNSQNRVISVNYLNDDAEILFSDVDFTNKTADEAAKMFVDISTKTGHINLSITAGTEVEITISAKTDANMEDLQKKVTEKVNKYFVDNGILAKAVCTIQANLQDALKKIDETASDLSNKTEEEILKQLGETTKDLDGIARSLHSEFFTQLKNFKNSLNYDAIEQLFDTAKQTVENYQSQIDEYNKTLNDNDIPEAVKEGVRPLLKAAQEELDLAKKQLKQAEKQFNEVKKQLDEKLDEVIKQLEEQSKTIYENLKSEYNKQIESAKALLESYKKEFEANKQAYQDAIKAYQAQNA